MKRLISIRFFVYAFIMVGLVVGNRADVSSADKPFYDGKTFVLVVATNPGGGYDFYGRAIANFMQDELPGSTFIVKNIPGAGNIIGINEVYRSKPNGLTFGIVNPGLIAAQLVGQAGIKFDLKKMTLLGATGESPYGIIAASPRFKNYEDAKKKDELLLACAGIGTLSYVIPMILKELKVLDNTKIMLGYRGAQAELAMMQGNIDAQWSSWSSVSSFVKDGHAIPILFVRSKPAESQNVYNVEDVVKDKENKSLIDFMETIAARLIRGFMGPPNIPSDQLQILRQAFKKVTQGPKYEEFTRKAGYPGGFISSEEQQQLVMDSFQVSPKHISIIKSAYSKK